jgi:hypothetical protein
MTSYGQFYLLQRTNTLFDADRKATLSTETENQLRFAQLLEDHDIKATFEKRSIKLNAKDIAEDLYATLRLCFKKAKTALEICTNVVHITKEENGLLLWARIRNEYERPSFARFLRLGEQLEHLSIDPDNPSLYFMTMLNLREQINTAAPSGKCRLPDTWLVGMALRRIPKSFGDLQTTLENGGALTLSSLQEAIMTKASNMKNKSSTNGSALYGVGSDNGRSRDKQGNGRSRRGGKGLHCTNPICKHLTNHEFKDCRRPGGPGYRGRIKRDAAQSGDVAHLSELQDFALLAYRHTVLENSPDVSDSEFSEYETDEFPDSEDTDLEDVPDLLDTSESEASDYEYDDFSEMPFLVSDDDSSDDDADMPAPQNDDFSEMPSLVSDDDSSDDDAEICALSVDAAGDEDCWIVDTGATKHLSMNAEDVQDFVSKRLPPVAGIDGTSNGIQPNGTGMALVTTVDSKGRPHQLRLRQTYIVPKLSRRLISVHRYCEDNPRAYFLFSAGHNVLHLSNGTRIDLDVASNGLYLLKGGPAVAHVATHRPRRPSEFELFHRRFGHVNPRLVAHIVKTNELPVKKPASLTKIALKHTCHSCSLSKATRLPLPKVAERKATRPFEHLHTDVWQARGRSLAGSRYAIIFVCEFTRYRRLYFLRKRSGAPDALELFVSEVVNTTPGAKCLRITSDCGGEFTGEEWCSKCRSLGIINLYSAPYSQGQNGIPERSWRFYSEMATSMLIDSGLPLTRFWAHAMDTADFVANWMPLRSIKGEIPSIMALNQQPDYQRLRVFGCVGYVREPTKLPHPGPRAFPCILVGYDRRSTAYLMYNPKTGKVIKTIHVHFNESLRLEDLKNGNIGDNEEDDIVDMPPAKIAPIGYAPSPPIVAAPVAAAPPRSPAPPVIPAPPAPPAPPGPAAALGPAPAQRVQAPAAPPPNEAHDVPAPRRSARRRPPVDYRGMERHNPLRAPNRDKADRAVAEDAVLALLARRGHTIDLQSGTSLH